MKCVFSFLLCLLASTLCAQTRESPLRIVALDSPDGGSICPALFVQAGEYIMGDGRGRWSTPESRVVVTRDFYLGQTEVTNGEYLYMLQWAYDNGHIQADCYEVVDWIGGTKTQLVDLYMAWSEIGFEDGRFFLKCSGLGHAAETYPDDYDPRRHPVKCVTWEGAAAFCDWINLKSGLPPSYDHATWKSRKDITYDSTGWRLPTDAEWELAATMGDERLYPWGNQPCSTSTSNHENSCHGWTTPVAAYQGAPCVGEDCFHDLMGNLWEWVFDYWSEPDSANVRIDPTGPDEAEMRILRGGAWWKYCDDVRCALRPPFPQDYKGGHVGFRIARTATVP